MIGCLADKLEAKKLFFCYILQVSKDLGHTKSLEKTANFEGHESTQVVEDNRKQNIEASHVVVQSEKKEVSDFRKVTSTSFSSSQSYSLEEEYEVEG